MGEVGALCLIFFLNFSSKPNETIEYHNVSYGIARDRIGNIDETSTALLPVDVAGCSSGSREVFGDKRGCIVLAAIRSVPSPLPSRVIIARKATSVFNPCCCRVPVNVGD